MDGKKSFILYTDLITVIEKLSDEQAGLLFKIIMDYVNDKNPEVNDLLMQVAFEPIKQQLKRDLINWSEIKVERIKAGHLGGVKSGEARRKQKEANEASALKSKQKEANEAVNVTVNDTVIGNGNVINNEYSFMNFWNLYDKKVGKRDKIEIKYNKLSLEIKKRILIYIPKYIESQPNKQYRKNPETFLNNEGWNDEIIKPKNEKSRYHTGDQDYSQKF